MVQLTLLLLFFASGFAGLVYQVLWLRQLGQLFGSTAHAAAMTLVVFFLGLSIGSWLWGKRAPHLRRPLRAYAWLEIGIPIAALAYFGLLDVYHRVYGGLFTNFHHLPSLFLAAKAILAMTLLLPAAILMGGTLPVMGQYLVRRADELATTATLLYAVNTAGAACGALAAGLFLPHALGYRRSYMVAMAINAAVAVAAWLLDRGADSDRGKPEERTRPEPAVSETDPLPPAAVYGVALLSGFTTLSLEVLWTKMFAQVLHNSVYSFAAILVVFLTSLGVGSAIAHTLCRRATPPLQTLLALLTTAGFGVAIVPFLFHAATGGLEYVAADAGWLAYVRAVFATAALVLFVPAVVVGAIFPFTLKMAENLGLAAGPTIGRMAAINTAGSIAGAGTAGFVLLPWLGLWASIKAMGLVYFAVAALLAQSRADLTAGWRMVPIAGLFLFATVFDSSRLGIVRTDPQRQEVVYQSWEGAHGVVAVVRRGDSLRIKVDNYYSLGGTAAATYERTQADLPLVIHGNPRSVFFLGLGTGITAGAAVEHPLESITVAELIPEVVEASRLYFSAYTNKLFDDERVRVFVEDGRNYLHGTRDRYDVIVADLFIPWQSGAAGLYSLEHFRAAKSRLRRGGLFAQWLPLYQLSRDEFFVIARTMLEVFPQVTLWRGDFLPDRPIVALFGHGEIEQPLDVDALVRGFARRKGDSSADRRAVMATTALFYAGNLTADAPRFSAHFVNTDDWPVIEYSAPITQREARGGGGRWFVGATLEQFYEELANAMPPRDDPYLAEFTDEEVGFVEAGRHLFASKVFQKLGDDERAMRHVDAYRERMPEMIREAGAERP